jgi:ADP-ribosyl-[dinitrogen reductase] hydrolase
MLIEIAIGDAYGAGFEYTADRLVREHNDLSAYFQHPRHGTKPGSYTDDTQMSIAIAEAIISGERWTPAMLARRFVEAFKRDPREGYARGFHAFLQEMQDEQEFLERIQPDSDKSGAAMRACPIGIFSSIGTVVERAQVQAALTHNTPGGIDAAIAAALMTHYFLYRLGRKADLGKFLASMVPGPWIGRWQGKVGPKGIMSVHAAMTAVVLNERMSDLLKACIAYTGDVDTVAAIALGAASCSDEIEQNLPEHLFTQLENGPFGFAFLKDLDAQLLGAHPAD